MKPIPECIPDILRLVLDAAERATSEPFIHRKVLARVMSALAEDGDFGQDPNDLVLQALVIAYKTLGVRDPYEKEKARRNRAVLGLEKEFEAFLSQQPDRLEAAIILSWAAAQVELDVLGREAAAKTTFERLRGHPPLPDHRAALLAAIAKSENIWIIAGDAGEIVIDRHLAAELHARGKKVTVAVGSRPLLALATMEDAEVANFAAVADVVEPGAAMFGLSLEKASVAFRERFAEADVVIAKGSVHFNAMREDGKPFFCFMRAQCAYEAKLWNVPVDSGILGLWKPDPAASGGVSA